MRYVYLLLASSLLLSACMKCPQQAGTTSTFDPDKKELKILSWNVYMLPPVIKSTFKKRRAKAIPETIIPEGYDIIVFQESFHKKARKNLWKRLKEIYPYALGPANMKPFSFKTNSGIWILSKMPLQLLGTTRYTDCYKIDCWGRKGALLAQGEWQGQTFQVLGTHLQADDATEVRQSQMRELRVLIDSFQTEGIPQILAGDFNTERKNAAVYQDMLKIIDAEDGDLLNDEVTLDGCMDDFKRRGEAETIANIIDYIFYRANGHQPQFIERRAREFTNENWHPDYKGLSDHNAVEMTIRF